MIQNDQDYIQEWLDHHRSIGFNHFYIYDNESTPPYSTLGEDVTITYWDESYYFEPIAPKLNEALISENSNSPKRMMELNSNILTTTHLTNYPAKSNKQYKAYQHCLNEYGDQHDWIAFIDSDELIMLGEGEILDSLLSEFNEFGQLLMYWRMFSSSGHTTKQSSQITAYTEWFPDFQFKPFVQPSKTAIASDIHLFSTYFQFKTVNENKEDIRLNFNQSSTHSSNRIWVNHYWGRSRQDFEETKLIRKGGATLRNDEYYEKKFKFIEKRAAYHMTKINQ